MGRGGELVRHVRENRRNVTVEAQQMRAVEKRGGRGRRSEKGAHSCRSENNSPVLCPEDRRCYLLKLRVRGEEGGLTFT